MSALQEGDNTEAIIESEQNSDSINQENKENPQNDKVSMIFEISRCQFFVIKNEERKQLSSGKLQIITDEPNRTELVFIFPDYTKITHTLCINKKRPCIKMCSSDYIFMVDGIDSFGLFIDTRNDIESEVIQGFESIIASYCYFRVSSKQYPIHKYPINEELTVGPPDKIAIAGMKLSTLICRGTVATAKGIRKATLLGTSGINKLRHFMDINTQSIYCNLENRKIRVQWMHNS